MERRKQETSGSSNPVRTPIKEEESPLLMRYTS